MTVDYENTPGSVMSYENKQIFEATADASLNVKVNHPERMTPGFERFKRNSLFFLIFVFDLVF